MKAITHDQEDDSKPMHTQHKVFTMATFAALGFGEALKASLRPDQLSEIDRCVRSEGAELALLITHDGENLKARISLLGRGYPEPFEAPLLTVQGPIDAAISAPQSVTVNDLSKMN